MTEEPTPAQEAARRKDTDDPRDAWVVCPECGSDEAVVVYPRDPYVACPECGAMEIMYRNADEDYMEWARGQY